MGVVLGSAFTFFPHSRGTVLSSSPCRMSSGEDRNLTLGTGGRRAFSSGIAHRDAAGLPPAPESPGFLANMIASRGNLWIPRQGSLGFQVLTQFNEMSFHVILGKKH